MTEELTLVLDNDLVKEATALFAEYGLTGMRVRKMDLIAGPS